MQQIPLMCLHFQGHRYGHWWFSAVSICGSLAECFFLPERNASKGRSEVLGGQYLGSRACLVGNRQMDIGIGGEMPGILPLLAGATLRYYASCLIGSQKDRVTGL